jgi:hypothetical protein
MTPFAQRVFLSVKLNAGIYEEVETDQTALVQAMSVVVLSSIAAGVGSVSQVGIGGLMLGTISALVGRYIWAGLTYFRRG